jgi:TonB family protein
MSNLLLYLLKVSAGTTLFYLCYLLLFRSETFYLRNRIFLILTFILPAIFPAIKIPVLKNSIAPSVALNTFDNVNYSQNSFTTEIPATINTFDFSRLFELIYFIVAAILLIRIIISLIATYRIIKTGSLNNNQFPKVVISDKHVPPFSFFPYAVIPLEDYKSGNYKDLLDHEFAHLRQGHTFDLLLSEFFIAFQWFNPLVWLIKRSVVLNHEYLADYISLRNSISIKDYQYRLLNFQSGLKNISLAHSFNSLIKNRIIMINKKPTLRYARLKNILILPLVAFVVYAFATPEYRYVTPPGDPLTIIEPAGIIQKVVKGIVLNENGKPLVEVHITVTGTMGNAAMATTGPDGRFSIMNVQEDASVLFFIRGYKRVSLKPDFQKEMTVKMERDPEYKAPEPAPGSNFTSAQRPEPLVVVDGAISEKTYMDVTKELGYNRGPIKYLYGKEAADKYGDKGTNGVYEITTRKKAIEMGLKPSFPRLAPEDYPTFQKQRNETFADWVAGQAKYPAEAKTDHSEGWVTINFKVELDGALSNIVSSSGLTDPLLVNEIMRVLQTSPKWDPPKNQNVDEPFTTSVTLRFKSPEQVLNEIPYVVVEDMPMYPGGDVELLNFIKNNTRYPANARAARVEGRVILRFIVTTEGKADGISILKGVDPRLDAEAVRIVSMLTGFTPGRQGGKPVNVWYMVPVTFKLTDAEALFSDNSTTELLRFLASNTGYPQEARNASDTGTIYVTVKMEEGAIIKECKAVTDKEGISVPFMPEILIVGYKTGGQNTTKSTGDASNEHLALKNECERVVKRLGEVNIPEWKDKKKEFALVFKFTLK